MCSSSSLEGLVILSSALTQSEDQCFCLLLSGLVKERGAGCLDSSCRLHPSTSGEWNMKGLVRLTRDRSLWDASGARDHISLEAYLALSVIWVMSLGGGVMETMILALGLGA